MASHIADYDLASITLKRRLQIGTVGGLVGGFAIFLIVFPFDLHLDVVPGTFYKIVGIPIGLDGTAATIFGMISHMLTAALIGAVFCFCSGLHKRLDLASTKKGALAGGVTSVAVYAIFFIPITLLVMIPTIESSMETDESFTVLANIESIKLMENMDLIIWGALELHIVYGIIMGIFCAMAMDYEIKNKKNKGD